MANISVKDRVIRHSSPSHALVPAARRLHLKYEVERGEAHPPVQSDWKRRQNLIYGEYFHP